MKIYFNSNFFCCPSSSSLGHLKGNERKESVKDRVSRRLEVFEKKKRNRRLFFLLYVSISLSGGDGQSKSFSS
jgi:hypothetical protein